jgi:hypothetical protein
VKRNEIIPSRRHKAEAWNREWRKRIADARQRGRERARMYEGKRLYEAAILDQDDQFHIIPLEGINNEEAAIAYIVAVYEPKDIIALTCIGYREPQPVRKSTMPGRPKLKLELE